MQDNHEKHLVIPRSATSFSGSLVSILAFLLIFIVSLSYKTSAFSTVFLWLFALWLPFLITELVYNKPFQHWASPPVEALRTTATRLGFKIIGLLGTLFVIGFCYWLFPFYIYSNILTIREWVEAALSLIGITGFLGVIGGVLAYLTFTDRYLQERHDGLWMAGQFFTGQWHRLDWSMLSEYTRGWIVKAFFLPLMAQWLFQNVKWVNGYFPSWELRYFFEQGIPLQQAFALFGLIQTTLFTLDLALGTLGYMMTSKLLGTHVRSTESTWSGWVACLLCYPPFFTMLDQGFLHYDDAITFETVFASVFWLKCVWGGIILVLFGIYTLATVQFGIRFSNLTHRGIITNGLYGWVKHPAYITKNLAWWMISLPFLSEISHGDALRHCVQLLLINGLYFWRAKTEEAHLAKDPDYRAYQAWIEQHGLWARLKQLVTRKPTA